MDNVFVPAVGDRDSDDLRQNSSALFPPEFYVDFLRNTTIMAKIGAEARYSECPNAPFSLFEKTGDVCVFVFLAWNGLNLMTIVPYTKDARTWLPQLSALANSRLKMLIWAGDADIK